MSRFVFWSAAFVLLIASASVSAQQAQSPIERRLVQLVSRVSFNEAGDSYHDLGLIWQIVEGSAETPAARVAWLERHSPCVSGRLTQDQARARPGNCVWARNIDREGHRPRGWDRQLHGRWSRARPQWVAHVPRVYDFVQGRDPYRPCAETPHSWDGTRYGRACVERGEDCPTVISESAARRRALRPQRVLDCDVPYRQPREEGEGLHNFAVRRDVQDAG